MSLSSSLRFLLQSVTAGLALAFVLVLLRPEWMQGLLAERPAAGPPPASAPAVAPLPSPPPPLSPPPPPSPAGPWSYAGAVEAAAPAVVNIFTAKRVVDRPNPLLEDPLLRLFFGDRLPVPRERLETSLGSGVIVSAGGFILTNHHVIRGAEAIEVALRDGRTAAARVVGIDAETDLAVLQVELADLPIIRMGESAGLRVGDIVLAIGNPYGVGQTVTHGIVSALNRNRVGINVFEDFIQTDAAINPGNSGGALINANGELVGINTAIVSGSGGAQGIGFAIPMSTVTDVLAQLVTSGSVTRGWLGLEAEDLTPELASVLAAPAGQGVVVRAILTDGPADRAGVQPGDLLLGLSGETVRDSRQVIDTIARMPPGAEVALTVLRGGQVLELSAVVARRPMFNAG